MNTPLSLCLFFCLLVIRFREHRNVSSRMFHIQVFHIQVLINCDTLSDFWLFVMQHLTKQSALTWHEVFCDCMTGNHQSRLTRLPLLMITCLLLTMLTEPPLSSCGICNTTWLGCSMNPSFICSAPVKTLRHTASLNLFRCWLCPTVDQDWAIQCSGGAYIKPTYTDEERDCYRSRMRIKYY